MLNWELLDASSKLDEVVEKSYSKDVVIFKHSTTCSISHVAKLRLEENWDLDDSTVPYYLDLLSHRNISNEIAERLQVHHESPQIILLREGSCIYDASHFDITVDELKESLAYHGK